MRPADLAIGGTKDHPFMRRWYLIPHNKVFNLFLNQFLMTDEVKELHNHPYFTLSLVFKGRYFEQGENGTKERRAGSFKFRSPWTFHRIIMVPGEHSWSLFMTGPKFWTWGFLCGKKIVQPAEYFTNGRGCS